MPSGNLLGSPAPVNTQQTQPPSNTGEPRQPSSSNINRGRQQKTVLPTTNPQNLNIFLGSAVVIGFAATSILLLRSGK